MLLQSEDDGHLHPVYYMRRKSTETQQKYDSYELEVLAIVEVLKKIYLLVLSDLSSWIAF